MRRCAPTGTGCGGRGGSSGGRGATGAARRARGPPGTRSRAPGRRAGSVAACSPPPAATTRSRCSARPPTRPKRSAHRDRRRRDARGAVVGRPLGRLRVPRRAQRRPLVARPPSRRASSTRGLASGQRYCWRVFARDGFGWQARSNEACLGTAPTTRAWRVERLAAGRWPALAIDAQGELHACFAGAGGLGIVVPAGRTGPHARTVDADGQAPVRARGRRRRRRPRRYLSRFGLRYAERVDRSAGVRVDRRRAGARRHPPLRRPGDRARRPTARRGSPTGARPRRPARSR